MVLYTEGGSYIMNKQSYLKINLAENT